MPKEHGASISFDDQDGRRLYAAWSRSGKRLGVSVSKDGDAWRDVVQMQLHPEQVKELVDFLVETTLSQETAE
jgi:hypothetical protein